MFYILSKILYFFILPVPIIVICLLIGFLSRKKKRQRFFRLTALILLVFFSNQFFSKWIISLWEYPVTPLTSIENYDVGIVLGGVTRLDLEPYDRTYFNRGADRLTHALHLYNTGKIGKILVTGGAPKNSSQTEASSMRNFLLMAGVPEQDILVDDRSRNTHENAVNSKEVLEAQKFNEPCLLITSAYHMRRASGCFRKEGINIIPFSCDFLSGKNDANWEDIFVPNVDALLKWTLLNREMAGFVMYRIVGYI